MVYDANVLYPAPLRDLLMHLARTGLFRARWTEEIHQEWMTNVIRNRPDLSPAQLERTRDLLNMAVLDCLVTGYESLTPTLQPPDPKDRHVLAAAIFGGARAIVTFNRRHFPASTLAMHGIEALHPDRFVHDLYLGGTGGCQASKRRSSQPDSNSSRTAQYPEKPGVIRQRGTIGKVSGTVVRSLGCWFHNGRLL